MRVATGLMAPAFLAGVAILIAAVPAIAATAGATTAHKAAAPARANTLVQGRVDTQVGRLGVAHLGAVAGTPADGTSSNLAADDTTGAAGATTTGGGSGVGWVVGVLGAAAVGGAAVALGGGGGAPASP